MRAAGYWGETPAKEVRPRRRQNKFAIGFDENARVRVPVRQDTSVLVSDEYTRVPNHI